MRLVLGEKGQEPFVILEPYKEVPKLELVGCRQNALSMHSLLLYSCKSIFIFLSPPPRSRALMLQVKCTGHWCTAHYRVQGQSEPAQETCRGVFASG